MVHKIDLSKESAIGLRGPLAGDEPLYFTIINNFLIYSSSLKELLELPEIPKPLSISPLGISFYLLNGVIPTPYTIYENIYVLNVGDRVEISYKENSFHLKFAHEFPFLNSQRDKEGEFDDEKVLRLLKDYVERKVNPDKPIYLFQSLGKDSNTILLSLSQSELKEKILCLTLSTRDRKDESEIAESIAQKLGFKHKKLYIPENPDKRVLEILDFYFENISQPCVDGASLAYPIYTLQIDFTEANLIDGSGNDMFFGHVPRPIEFKRQKIYSLFTFLRPLADSLETGNLLQPLTKTRAEWIGLDGLTLKDAKRIFPRAISTFLYWKEESEKRKAWDYFDLKADLWGTNVEYDCVMKKCEI